MNRFMNMLMRVYMEEAGGDEDSGGGGAEPPKTYTQAEVDALTAGLRAKADELLTEKKTEAQKRKDADAERTRLAQESAKNAGKLDEFEKTIRGQYDPLIAEKDQRLSAMQDRILGSERKAVMGNVLSKGNFIDASAADLLAQFVKTEFDGDDVVTKFVGADGNVITTDIDEFVKYCSKHKVISHLMKADAATGGGANGNKNPNGGAGGDPTLTGYDKAKADIHKKLSEKYKA